jgi:hypothetical protein
LVFSSSEIGLAADLLRQTQMGESSLDRGEQRSRVENECEPPQIGGQGFIRERNCAEIGT